jgi:glycerol-3-phosphate acyltransferase PlsX
MVNFVITLLKQAFQTSWLAKASYLLASFPLKKMKSQINPKSYNGAILIGAGGIAIKSHGGADGEAFAAAIQVAARMASHDFNHKIEKKLSLLDSYKPSGSEA